ncbi:hypothetical protein RJ640_012311 [Escallonia rubra]|uniref:Protein SAR DEFICIENT 1 n=1 Tax=Escallonia rubra TaxID=112253 RepID=A0AA88U4F1_9ASTE|nr:hypothetical protein RJ640_012311 [Escallonia rubra]
MLRRVVNNEVERGLKRRTSSLTRSASLRIQALEPTSLMLMFSKDLSLPLFTGSKIIDVESNPLQVIVVDTRGDQNVPTTLPYPLKVEIVVLDGDFPRGDCETWTSDEFGKNIVKERTGRRPLLAGELNLTMRDGFSPIGDIEFTDNSSWIRSRKFRLGARVVQGARQGVKIKEAMTKAFVVKDHRGELYKKHHPPMLKDEVWRLEKIGKDGAFHRKLASEDIKSVQDFLKLSIVDPSKLRTILGVGMSEKMWEVTLKHARTCVMGRKLYISQGPNYTIILNPICQVVKAVINGQIYTNHNLTISNRAFIENLVRDAYTSWNSLEEVDGTSNAPALLTHGTYCDFVDQYSNQCHATVRSDEHHARLMDESLQVASMPSNAIIQCNDWVVSSAYISSTPTGNGIRYNFSDSSSDGEAKFSRSFVDHGS